jgi:hypothetical protein
MTVLFAWLERTSNGKCNRRSFDCVAQKNAVSNFAQDDGGFWIGRRIGNWNWDGNGNSRSPSEMTTREATATAMATADPLRG